MSVNVLSYIENKCFEKSVPGSVSTTSQPRENQEDGVGIKPSPAQQLRLVFITSLPLSVNKEIHCASVWYVERSSECVNEYP